MNLKINDIVYWDGGCTKLLWKIIHLYSNEKADFESVDDGSILHQWPINNYHMGTIKKFEIKPRNKAHPLTTIFK